QTTADRRSRPRWSGIVRSPVDRGSARTRHPDTVAIDATAKLAAVLMLLEEGVERREQHQARLIQGVCSIARRTRLIWSHGCQSRASRALAEPSSCCCGRSV